jgi:hypothetical protein
MQTNVKDRTNFGPSPDKRLLPAQDMCREAIDYWLWTLALRDRPLARDFLREHLIELGVSTTVVEAIGSVPRHPFLPPNEVRLAHAMEIKSLTLLSPLRLAYLLDGLALQTGERLFVVQRRLSWSTLVAGVLAAGRGVRVGSTAAGEQGQEAFIECLQAIGVEVGAPLPLVDSAVETVIITSPCARPPRRIYKALTDGGRVTWGTHSVNGLERVYRIQRNGGRYRLTNLGIG